MPADAEPAKTEIQSRVEAAQATLDKFKDKPFKWGTRDCSRLVAHHIRLLGHKVKMPPSGSYGTLLGAKKALRAAGYSDVPEALDAMGFERVPPAGAYPGDVVQWPSSNEIASLGVVLTNGRIVGYHEDAAGACVMQPIEYIAAWRVGVAR